MKETTAIHTRIMRCALEVEDSRAYWLLTPQDTGQPSSVAFEQYWFGGKSLARTQVLLANFRARYAAWPQALAVLHRWPGMAPEVRRLVCHWHLQLTDPLYRAFTGEFLPERLASGRPDLTFAVAVAWVNDFGPARWQMASKRQVAGKLLSAAKAAGIVGSATDPRPIRLPNVPDVALEYLFYLLRATEFAGTLLENPYLRSVGLEAGTLETRLKGLAGLRFGRQGGLVDIGWPYADLAAWAEARLGAAVEARA
jgi:hypothetical protein